MSRKLGKQIINKQPIKPLNTEQSYKLIEIKYLANILLQAMTIHSESGRKVVFVF